MSGMRCKECGELRWSIFERDEETAVECPACGAQMTVERRYPGGQAREEAAERRDASSAVSPVRIV